MALLSRTFIRRQPSPFWQQAIPIATVMLGSLTPILPVISTSPSMPPLGLMALLSWRSLHRDIWPIWMPLCLGFFDDLFSGQPMGSAMLLWTSSFLLMEALDRRMVWRDFTQEWMLAGTLITLIIFGNLAIGNMTGGGTSALVVVPQILISIGLFPLVSRLCARLDQMRL